MQSATTGSLDSGNTNRASSPVTAMGSHVRRPSTSSFTTARDQPSPAGIFDTQSEISRHEFQTNLAMYGQLTKMTSSLSVCMPEMEKLSTTLLDWCRSVDKSFSLLQTEILGLRDEISTRNAQVHTEFHRAVTEIQQQTETTFQDKCVHRLDTIEHRLDLFAQKVTQLQDQLFQKMTSVLEVQTNFTSVVNTLRNNQDGVHDEIRKVTDDGKKALGDNTKELHKIHDGLANDVKTVQERLEHADAEIRMHSTALNGIAADQKNCMDNCYGLGQKLANVQMEFHDQIAGLQDGLINLDRQIGYASQRNDHVQNNEQFLKHQEDFQLLFDEVKRLQKALYEQEAKVSELSKTTAVLPGLSETVTEVQLKNDEQDARITSLENSFHSRVDLQIVDSTENIHLHKDVNDLLKKVNIIFETVGTLRTEVAGLKSAQTSPTDFVYVSNTNPSPDVYAKSTPEYTLPFGKPNQQNFSNTCSLGYENCFLSKSGLCSETFHLPKKSPTGFHSVTPSFVHNEGVAEGSGLDQLNETFRDIVAKNVVSLDDAPLMKINNARHISGHI
ncbi:uncharacterized protein LOC129582672 [Paramacrobiotus metropolitanus]|uniref:uncharacterized protein LOC129582672 n=1 Tax=Paramacrobiotus metropolitanus TaxID=2943436 RepID=UPI00244596BB|nr:uncharacterized protein LOC129582672 [Paramacrobiotus metropolitanus]